MTPEEWAAKALEDIKDDRNERTVGDRVADAVRQAVAEALSAGLPGPTLTAAELGAIKARHSATTSREWVYNGVAVVWVKEEPNRRDVLICDVFPNHNLSWHADEETGKANAEFIAHAHQDIPRMVAHVEHLEGLFRDLSNDGRLDEYRRGLADGAKAKGEPPVIRVTRRGDDWDARLASDPRLWCAGRTPDEAVGDLVRTHPGAFGVKVKVEVEFGE